MKPQNLYQKTTSSTPQKQCKVITKFSKADKIKESMTASTYYEVSGHDFDIDLYMIGSDGFKQTIHYPDGSKSVKVYERLK